MGWSTLPSAGGAVIRASWFEEIQAAITERKSVVVAGTIPADVVSKDLIKLRDEYRTAVESLFPYFRQSSGTGQSITFTQWTKATIMTECFGAGVTDWPNIGSKLLRAQDFNDMRTVLNELDWLVRNLGSSAYEHTTDRDYHLATRSNAHPIDDWAGVVEEVFALIDPTVQPGVGSDVGWGGTGGVFIQDEVLIEVDGDWVNHSTYQLTFNGQVVDIYEWWLQWPRWTRAESSLHLGFYGPTYTIYWNNAPEAPEVLDVWTPTGPEQNSLEWYKASSGIYNTSMIEIRFSTDANPHTVLALPNPRAGWGQRYYFWSQEVNWNPSSGPYLYPRIKWDYRAA